MGARISIQPYHPSWPAEYERVRVELVSALPSWVLSIDHVGSTSVPGLDAKPIIDILVGVPDLRRCSALVPIFETLGFEYRPNDDLPDRYYFPRTIDGLRRYHVSVAEPSARHHKNTLVFRDALRRDPDLAARYGALKRSLAGTVGSDRLSYLNGKTDFIIGVLEAEGAEVSGDYPTRNLGSSAGQRALPGARPEDSSEG